MNLWKRAKNLWKWSKFEPPESILFHTDTKSILELGEKPKQAEIIKKTEPIEDFLKNYE